MTYNVKLHEVKEEKLPPLNDDFAKDVGEGFETLLALRAQIREDIEKAETEAALRAYETAGRRRARRAGHGGVRARQCSSTKSTTSCEDQANMDPRDPRAQLIYLQRMNKSEAGGPRVGTRGSFAKIEALTRIE